jgi:hypothetical protein
MPILHPAPIDAASDLETARIGQWHASRRRPQRPYSPFLVYVIFAAAERIAATY